MRPKGVAVIVGVAVVILAVVFLPIKPNGIPPTIGDVIEIEDGSIIELNTGDSDTIGITDGVTIEKETSLKYYFNDEGTKYYIDENGRKHFVLSVEDSPSVEE